MLRSVLFLVAFLALSSAYDCNGTVTLDAPLDLSKPTYFPSFWTENQTVPDLSKSQSCEITVNIPTGVYATVTFFRNFGSSSGTYVLYTNNKYKFINDNDLNPYIFTPPKFRLELGANSWLNTTQFAFKIIWSKFPDPKQNIVNIYKGKPPVVVSGNADLTTFIADTKSQLSLMAFSLMDPSQEYLLRKTAVFAGDSMNGEFVGTLDLILASNQAITTYKNKMSVYTFGSSQTINYPLFMAQDAADARRIMSYKGFNCPSTGNCNVTLFGNYGNSWTVSDFNGSEYVKDFNSFPETATISVYENNISNTTCIATLTSFNYKSLVPLEVKGTMKFYALNGYGNVEMVVTRDTFTASRLL